MLNLKPEPAVRSRLKSREAFTGARVPLGTSIVVVVNEPPARVVWWPSPSSRSQRIDRAQRVLTGAWAACALDESTSPRCSCRLCSLPAR